VEVSRSLAKEGDVTYGNITKVKATKNKMNPPYRQAQFEIVYGEGIDKIGEIMELLNEFELGRKYGKTFTFNETKYDLEEFKKMLLDNDIFYNEIRDSIVNKIKNTEIKADEEISVEG
jgi:recombination protein RecA